MTRINKALPTSLKQDLVTLFKFNETYSVGQLLICPRLGVHVLATLSIPWVLTSGAEKKKNELG